MAVRVQIARLVPFVRVVRARLLVHRWCALVAVTMRVEVTRDVALVGMVGARLLGLGICHVMLLGLMQPRYRAAFGGPVGHARMRPRRVADTQLRWNITGR